VEEEALIKASAILPGKPDEQWRQRWHVNWLSLHVIRMLIEKYFKEINMKQNLLASSMEMTSSLDDHPVL